MKKEAPAVVLSRNYVKIKEVERLKWLREQATQNGAYWPVYNEEKKRLKWRRDNPQES